MRLDLPRSPFKELNRLKKQLPRKAQGPVAYWLHTLSRRVQWNTFRTRT